MNVKLVSITKPINAFSNDSSTPEGFIAYCARVSSSNQENPEYEKLIRYCIENKHWSIFEMVDMTFEIETSRIISAQITRHKSFSFQEFSQRYAPAQTIEPIELRYQGENKQGSANIYTEEHSTNGNGFYDRLEELQTLQFELYDDMLKEGISRETARQHLPMATQTRLYMKGSIRSWIHYLEVRLHEHTQKEHREIAIEILKVFAQRFTITTKALYWDKKYSDYLQEIT